MARPLRQQQAAEISGGDLATVGTVRDDDPGTAAGSGTLSADADPAGWGWRAWARCGQADPELFFPVEGEPALEAVRICGACPVRSECLEWALASEEPWGIWGGLSAAERETVLVARRIAALQRWRDRNAWHAATVERRWRRRRPHEARVRRWIRAPVAASSRDRPSDTP